MFEREKKPVLLYGSHEYFYLGMIIEKVFCFLVLVFEWSIGVGGKIISKAWVTSFGSLDFCIRYILYFLSWIWTICNPVDPGLMVTPWLSLRYFLYASFFWQLISWCPAVPPDDLLLPIIFIPKYQFVLRYKSFALLEKPVYLFSFHYRFFILSYFLLLSSFPISSFPKLSRPDTLIPCPSVMVWPRKQNPSCEF